MSSFSRVLTACLFLGLCLHTVCTAQFKENAFTQQYNSGADTLGRDSTDKMFSFKELFDGYRHKSTARIGVVFGGSTVFVGGYQIYNRQYWKLPVIYGGLAATAGLGTWYRYQYNTGGTHSDKVASDLLFAGAGLIYWGALMDGVYNYRRDGTHQAGKATLYSIMLPGLGQAYNGEYWKIPIYYTAMIISGSLLVTNNKNYHRYKDIHNWATAKDGSYDGPINASTALYYRNIFRRYRDYSVVALAGFYLLQVIDANVFAYMQDFEISEDLSLKVAPAVLPAGNSYAYGGGALGVSFGLRF